MTDINIIVAILLIYLTFMLGIGVWARRSAGTSEGYFLAGRKLPYWIAAFSMNATGESAWLLLGLSGAAYLTGLQAFWIVAGEVIGVGLAWLLVAKKLNKQSRELSALTVPDFLAESFRGETAARYATKIRWVSVIIILSMAVAYIAAQMLATGKAFNVFLGWDYSTGVWVGGLVTVAYTAFGGFKAVAYTDAAQALLMLFALVAIPLVGLVHIGGITPLWQGLESVGPAYSSLIGATDITTFSIIAVLSALAIGLPMLGVPQLLVRFMAIRDTSEVKKAAGVSIVVILFFDAGAVATGLIGRVLFPDLISIGGDSENIMPTLAQELFPPVITGLMVVAVLSAVMSTVSSLLNLASSAIVHDFFNKVRHAFSATGSSGKRKEASLAQWTTLVLGLGGCLIAMQQTGVIFDLVLFAWSGLGAAFGPVILCLLHWKKTTQQGVFAGMIAGFSTSILWVLFAKQHFYDLYEMVPAFIVATCVTVIVSYLTCDEGINQ